PDLELARVEPRVFDGPEEDVGQFAHGEGQQQEGAQDHEGPLEEIERRPFEMPERPNGDPRLRPPKPALRDRRRRHGYFRLRTSVRSCTAYGPRLSACGPCRGAARVAKLCLST